MPEPWQRFESASNPGKLFYLNEVTNESVWEDLVGSSSSRKRPAKTQGADAENCRKTTIRWSNAIKRVVALMPHELHFSKVNGGAGPYHGEDHAHLNWTPDRGPFTGTGTDWKRRRERPNKHKWLPPHKRYWNRSEHGDGTWTDSQMQTWAQRSRTYKE